jgi:hypothetical protein
LQLQRLHDESELVHACLGEILEHEVLEQMDIIDGEGNIVNRRQVSLSPLCPLKANMPAAATAADFAGIQ